MEDLGAQLSKPHIVPCISQVSEKATAFQGSSSRLDLTSIFCGCCNGILHSWIFLTFESCVKMLLILVMAALPLICRADC